MDAVTTLTIGLANTSTFQKTRGNLDADGRALAPIVVPSGLTAAVGRTLHFAYVVADSRNFLVLASNAARLTIKP